MRVTPSFALPVSAHGWVSYPLDRVTDPAQVPPGSPGGVGGVIGPVTHLWTGATFVADAIWDVQGERLRVEAEGEDRSNWWPKSKDQRAKPGRATWTRPTHSDCTDGGAT